MAIYPVVADAIRLREKSKTLKDVLLRRKARKQLEQQLAVMTTEALRQFYTAVENNYTAVEDGHEATS